MSASTLNSATRGYALSFAVTSILSALLVLLKELNEGVLAFMKAITVHHWVTHGLFDVIVFLALGAVLAKAKDGNGVDIDDDKLIQLVVGSFLLGSAIIAAFYLYDTLKG